MFRKSPPDPSTLDTSSRRSRLIGSQHDDHVLATNFYHAGRFWNAKIPLHATDTIHGQSFNFSRIRTRRTKQGREVVYNNRGVPKPRFSCINHLLCRFRLQDGHTIDLFDAGWSTPVHQIDDFVYSVEAVGPKGVPFDFKNGLAGTLVCAHRFMSTQEMVFERVVVQGHYVWESPALPLSDFEKRTVLHRSLLRSDEAGLDEVYYLYRFCATNNCTSNPFRIVDQSVTYKFIYKLGSLVYRLPLSPRWYLRMRGLDADPGFFKLARVDFDEYIADPETQQRKRNVVRAAIRDRRAAKLAGQA